MSALIETYTLSNGNQIPKIGFGTWLLKEGSDGARRRLSLGAPAERHDVRALHVRRRRRRTHEPDRPLDTGIVRALWLTYDDIAARRDVASQPARAALDRRLSRRPALAART